jgi:hypothetical protein
MTDVNHSPCHAVDEVASATVLHSAGHRIAVDRHADAGCVLTVCLRANHIACSHRCSQRLPRDDRRLALETANQVALDRRTFPFWLKSKESASFPISVEVIYLIVELPSGRAEAPWI